MNREGFVSATSDVAFGSETELHEHYRSDFHRYNLKRRVAGLGPVTKEWFETHKDMLVSAGRGRDQKQDLVYYDPLSRKTFNSERKYLEYTKSNKYKKLLKTTGAEAPEPIVRVKGEREPPATAAAAAAADKLAPASLPTQEEEMDGYESDSSWETASGDEEGPMEVEAATTATGQGGEGEEDQWDACVSFFDNHKSKSVEDNMEYMYKKFGFSIPDAEFLSDPEGLLQYLGAKMSHGHIPFYASGLDANSKSFQSLHAVQRHMIDTGKTKMLYEGNEEEYEDYYDYQALAESYQADEMQVGEASGGVWSNGYELMVPAAASSSSSQAGKVIGSRNLARYYKQKHRPAEARESVLVNRIVSRYRLLGLQTCQIKENKARQEMVVSESKRRQHFEDVKTHYGIANAVINNLPRNVPY